MKLKRIFTSVLLAILVLFSGCGDYRLDLEDLRERVVGVEIVYLKKQMEDSDILEGDIQQLSVLQENEILPFLELYSEIKFNSDTKKTQGPRYYTIKLIYTDGSFDLQSLSGSGKYDSNGKFLDWCDSIKEYSVDMFYQIIFMYCGYGFPYKNE